jgi:hypothetical protein
VKERQQHVESEICEIDLGLATRFSEKLLYRCKYERVASRVGINSFYYRAKLARASLARVRLARVRAEPELNHEAELFYVAPSGNKTRINWGH